MPRVARRHAWVLHGVGTLPGRLLAGDGAGWLIPSTHAVGLSIVPLRGLVEARVSDREHAVVRPARACYDARRLRPFAHAQRTVVHFGHDEEVTQYAVLDRELVQAAPVAAGLHECEPNPRLPLQRRHAVHRPGAQVARQQHAAKHVTHRAQRFPLGFVQQWRHLGHVPSDQEKALAALCQAAQLATVVRRLGRGVAVGAQQLGDLIEQGSAARGQARHVLEQHQLGRIVGPSFEHQPHAAQREPIQGLVLPSQALSLRQKTAEALARRTQEHDVRALATGGALEVLRRRFAPISRRVVVMKGAVLLSIEQVQHGAWRARQASEVTDGGGIDIDPTDASE